MAAPGLRGDELVSAQHRPSEPGRWRPAGPRAAGGRTAGPLRLRSARARTLARGESVFAAAHNARGDADAGRSRGADADRAASRRTRVHVGAAGARRRGDGADRTDPVCGVGRPGHRLRGARDRCRSGGGVFRPHRGDSARALPRRPRPNGPPRTERRGGVPDRTLPDESRLPRRTPHPAAGHEQLLPPLQPQPEYGRGCGDRHAPADGAQHRTPLGRVPLAPAAAGGGRRPAREPS